MNNKNIRVLVFILVLSLILPGCTDTKDKISSEILENREDYFRIIWVPENYSYSDYDHHFFSFRITDLTETSISGKYSFDYSGSVAYPECYYWNWDPYPDLGEFHGTLTDKTAECTFENKRWEDNWDRGTVVLDLSQPDRINAEIHFTETAYQHYEPESTDGCFVFRPHNLSDYSDAIDSTKTISVPVELDSWGEVNFTLIWIDSNRPFNRAFLTDKDNNILYDFPPLINGVEFINIIIEDQNGDGLKDICLSPDESIFADYMDELEMMTYRWLQMDDGLFYSDHLDSDDR